MISAWTRVAVTLLFSALPAQAQLPLIESADFDKGFRVNGKPFFPILLYDAPTDDKSLEQFRDFGFNVVTCSEKDCGGLPAKGLYGAVHVGKKVDNARGLFLAIGVDSPALNFKKDLLQKTADYNAKVKAAVPNRPLMNAIGYWEDEPEGVYAGKLPSKEKYDDLVRMLDVSAPYLYPVPYQPVASVGDAVARARRATDGKKPLLPILQLFAWKAGDRYPTAAELRCMVFLSLAEGAHGIGYYSYGHVTGKRKTVIAAEQPELWKSVKDLNREVAEIGPKLLAGKSTDAVRLEKEVAGVRVKAVVDGDTVLAVIVNGAPERREVRLKAMGAIGTTTLHPFEVKVVRQRMR